MNTGNLPLSRPAKGHVTLRNKNDSTQLNLSFTRGRVTPLQVFEGSGMGGGEQLICNTYCQGMLARTVIPAPERISEEKEGAFGPA